MTRREGAELVSIVVVVVALLTTLLLSDRAGIPGGSMVTTALLALVGTAITGLLSHVIVTASNGTKEPPK